MNPDDLILISVDDHVVEPPDMFVGRLPKKYEAEAPHLVRTDDGFDVWKFRQYTIPNSALRRPSPGRNARVRHDACALPGPNHFSL